MHYLFFFKQKTAYEMRISDWSSDVCSSDLDGKLPRHIEPSRRTSDVCDGSRFNANAEGRHAVHVVPAIMVHAEENDQFRIERANARARLLEGSENVEHRRALAGRRSEERRVGKGWVSTCRTGWRRDH